jgi:hypothetical protein
MAECDQPEATATDTAIAESDEPELAHTSDPLLDPQHPTFQKRSDLVMMCTALDAAAIALSATWYKSDDELLYCINNTLRLLRAMHAGLTDRAPHGRVYILGPDRCERLPSL